VIVEADRKSFLRSRRTASVVVTLAGMAGVAANLAEISWIATVVLTIMAILGAIGWASYSADLHAMQIEGPNHHRKGKTPN
jgi:hypothetical protein